MRVSRSYGLLLRLLIPLVCILLFGIASRAYSANRSLRQADQYLERGNSAKDLGLAAGAFSEAARQMPWRNDWWERAGRLALESEDPKTALLYLSSASALSNSGKILLGDAYLVENDLASARKVWEAALFEAGAENRLSLLERLYPLYLSQENWPAARTSLEALLALNPEDPQANYHLGLLLAVLEPAVAPDQLQRAADLDPTLQSQAESLRRNLLAALLCNDLACTLVENGRALGGVGEWQLAAAAFKAAAGLRPDYPEAWAFLGEAQQHLDAGKSTSGQPVSESLQDTTASESGLVSLEKALALDPSSVSARLLLALYWQRQGDIEKALAITQAAANELSGSPATQATLGANLAALGDLPAALEAYQQAVALAPQDPAYLRLLASFTIQYDHAVGEIGLPAARRAVLLDGNSPDSLDILGLVLFHLGDLVNAERFYQRAMELDPDFAPAHLHLGLIFLLQNDAAEAYSEFSRARDLATGTPLAEQAERLIESNFP